MLQQPDIPKVNYVNVEAIAPILFSLPQRTELSKENPLGYTGELTSPFTQAPRVYHVTHADQSHCDWFRDECMTQSEPMVNYP